jgi:2-polyprenyl-6-methoxyphenol hydroxylase-like FAD-dependent oxidoreductase
MKYDAVVVGGGLGGSVLAKQLARAGHAVLVLERETRFRDRVRGENIMAWGVAVARRLGIYDDLIAAGAQPAPNFRLYVMGQPMPMRDLRATTPTGEAMLNVFHPDMQEGLLGAAIAGGATVERGATVLGVDSGPNRSPTVTYEFEGQRRTVEARIVVGADGRASQTRTWGGFHVRKNPDNLRVAGMLIEGTDVPEGGSYFAVGEGVATFWAAHGHDRARTYFVYPGAAGSRGFTGKDKIPEYLKALQSLGTPESWLSHAKSIGPLAEFEGAERWVPAPARNGVVLIGDAAGATDPSWGSGLACTIVDVECLANALRSTPDWDAAIAEYAREHDEYYGALHRIHEWMTEAWWTPGPEADARRARIVPMWWTPLEGFPDLLGRGPFGPSDERARGLLLGFD